MKVIDHVKAAQWQWSKSHPTMRVASTCGFFRRNGISFSLSMATFFLDKMNSQSRCKEKLSLRVAMAGYFHSKFSVHRPSCRADHVLDILGGALQPRSRPPSCLIRGASKLSDEELTCPWSTSAQTGSCVPVGCTCSTHSTTWKNT